MPFPANPGLDTGQMFWHWSQAETTKKKNLLDWTKLKMQGSLPQEFDVISKFLIIDSVTYWGRIQPPP